MINDNHQFAGFLLLVQGGRVHRGQRRGGAGTPVGQSVRVYPLAAYETEQRELLTGRQ